MDAKVRDGLLKKADEMEKKANACIRPADKHHYLLLAASFYRKAGCEAASRLTHKLAGEALHGKLVDLK